MTVSLTKTAFASTAAQSVTLSNVLSVTNDGKDPAYLIVNGLDRDEYTASSTGALGTLTGNNATARFTQGNDDGRGLGIVFTWNAVTGSYVNATYGNLLNLTMNTSASPNELADLSFYGTNSQSAVTAYGSYLNDAGTMCQLSDTASAPFTYIGSATFATQSVGAPSPATQPAQATPDSICATALKFIGDTWNIDGCWVLASTIDAEAGAGLPVSSSFATIPGQASGEWKVAYNGPVSANANWQSLVQAGDQVALITASGSGHITTVVSGTGSTAQLVDNIDYGSNEVNDSTGNDLTIAPAHSVSQEFPGANPSYAVIYRLDTPTITAVSATQTVSVSASVAFTGLFSASDWAGTAITEYQAYETTSADSLVVNGTACSTDTSATTCATVSSLSALGLLSGTTAGANTLYLRALNAGGYWGDWRSTTLTVNAAKPVTPPTLVAQTPAQTIYGGQTLSFSVAAAFKDPNGSALTDKATLSSGAALPSWLTFNPANDTFSGTAPAAAQTVSVRLTATNTGGASASETFTITDKTAPAPLLVSQTPAQTVYAGQVLSFSVAGAFKDPNGETLTETATLASGAALPSWLTFNAATGAFRGTAPATAQAVSVKVTATNQGGSSTSETFTITDKLDVPVVSAATPALTVSAGQTIAFSTAGVFTDPAGATLTEAATLASGAALPSWLKFSAATDRFSGTAPITPQTLSLKVSATNAAGQSASETFSLFIKSATAATGAVSGRQDMLAALQQEWTATATSRDLLRTNFALTTGTFRETVPLTGASDSFGADSQRPAGGWPDLHHSGTLHGVSSPIFGLHG